MTGNIMIPEGAQKEKELDYNYKIVFIVGKCNIHTP